MIVMKVIHFLSAIVQKFTMKSAEVAAMPPSNRASKLGLLILKISINSKVTEY